MKDFVKNIKQDIETEIERIELIHADSLEGIELIVSYIQMSTQRLREFVTGYRFENDQEEILFFKVWKPSVTSLLMYYVRLYHIEKKRTKMSSLAQCHYLKKEQEAIGEKMNNNFYQYYCSGKTSLDGEYFLRSSYNVLRDAACLSFEKDHSFSTLHDYNVADIMADNLLATYLTSRIDALSEQLYLQLLSSASEGKLQWTESKIALVEFIYALYACGCFNKGDTTLKEIASCFELLFNMEVGDFYRAFLEIRGRKKSRTQFLDKMKEELIKMMDGLDK